MSTDPTLGERYRAACVAEGFDQGFFLYPTGPSFVHVAEDPERAWAELAPYALYDATSYSTWQTGDHDNVVDMGGRSTVDELRASGMWQVLTPDECVALVERTGGGACTHSWAASRPSSGGAASSSTTRRCSPVSRVETASSPAPHADPTATTSGRPGARGVRAPEPAVCARRRRRSSSCTAIR